MKTKITLSVDKDLVDFAHKRAKSKQTTISSMFSELMKQERLQANRAEYDVSGMVGSLRAYNIDDSKQAIRTSYAKKYSR